MAAPLSPCPVAGLVLAAGYSKRFGADKRQARLATGETLLNTSLALPRPSDHPDELQLPDDVRLVQDAATALGMGHSIAAGVRRLLAESRADALAIFLADMPLIARSSLDTLLVRAAPDRIIVPLYQGSRGHPVLFGRVFWPELVELVGDSGTRLVIDHCRDVLEPVELDDPGVLHDVDQPRDWRALLASR